MKKYLTLGIILCFTLPMMAQKKGLGINFIYDAFSREVIVAQKNQNSILDSKRKSLYVPQLSLMYFKEDTKGNYRTFYLTGSRGNTTEDYYIHRIKVSSVDSIQYVYSKGAILRHTLEVGTTKNWLAYKSKNQKFMVFLGLNHALNWSYKGVTPLNTTDFKETRQRWTWTFRFAPTVTYQIAPSVFLDAGIYNFQGFSLGVNYRNDNNPLIPEYQRRQLTPHFDLKTAWNHRIGTQIGIRYALKARK